MNNYPNQPPQLPPPSGQYNPYNQYTSYDQTQDYVSWLPGRQGPRFLPIAIVVALVLVCSCCSFLAGTVFGIELPGFLEPSSSQVQPDGGQAPDQGAPQNEPTPESFQWGVTYGIG